MDTTIYLVCSSVFNIRRFQFFILTFVYCDGFQLKLQQQALPPSRCVYVLCRVDIDLCGFLFFSFYFYFYFTAIGRLTHHI